MTCRLLLSAFFVMVSSGCATSPESPAQPTVPIDAMVGRWDVTATEEGGSYPLWFEIRTENGSVRGRLQPRGGHALELEKAEVTDHRLTLAAGNTSLSGEFVTGSFRGTGQRGDNAFEWAAVRAPELPANAAPKWGEPISLFNGTDLTGWKPRNESHPNLWSAEQGVLVNKGRGADLVTEDSFQDFKLHIEVNCPEGSNSGIYLRGRYEIQVEDSFGKEAHSRHLGGVYGQVTPTSNPAKEAGEWQTLDITLLGRWVTVELNGVTIIDRQEIPGITGGAMDAREGEPGPLMIQGDHGAVSYRNIVLTPVLP